MSIKTICSAAPPKEVLDAFGLTGDAALIAGGRGLCYRVGDIILKPADNEAEAQWVSQLAVRVLERRPSHYILSRPLAIIHKPDEYVFSGWTASTFIDGVAPFKVQVEDTFAISRAFCADLAALEIVAPPACLSTRLDRWSEADRVTWGEKQLEDVENVDAELLQLLNSSLEPLKAMMKPLPTGLDNQLMHADITGNILFNDKPESPPAIIDLTMYWRPATYAEAIVVADCLTWHGAGRDLIDLYATDHVKSQLLVRAMYWRNITFAIDPDREWIRQHIGQADFQGALRALMVCIGQ